MRELDDITEAIIDAVIQIDREEGFRTDLIVDHQVIVELKSVERLAPVHLPPFASPRLRVNQSSPNRFPEG